MVGIGKLEKPAEIAEVRAMIEKHLAWTQSARARQVLADWRSNGSALRQGAPKDYQRMLSRIEQAHAQGLSGDEAIMVAFEENARDLSRVGGN